MKNIAKNRIIVIGLCLGLSLGACTDYLDKAPESSLTETEVFGSFVSFQGWVEQMYACIINPHQLMAGNWYRTFNFTDMLSSVPMEWDDGNYWNQKFLYAEGARNLSGNIGVMSKYLWPLAWYGIRKANVGLENLDRLEGSQEEKDLIRGQCLYFRAWFHFEMIQYWGGLPYVDKPLSVSEVIAFPRLPYDEIIMRIAEDFQSAAELLPLDWKNTNTLVADIDGARITKYHALGYKAKALLYAASPMMNETVTGRNEYNRELCQQAAAVFAEVIALCERPDSKYKLETWAKWPTVFHLVVPGATQMPGGTEVIQNQIMYETGYPRWTTTRAASPAQFTAGNNCVETPAHNYVKYYGMASGLPIDDPSSGYDPANPWDNRDPRFYHDIVYEGVRMIKNAGNANAKLDEFAQLSNTGRHRHGTAAAGTFFGSVSGYFYKKFNPLGCNNYDNEWGNLQAYQPRLRVADLYLMYAEAVFYGYGSAGLSAPGSLYTAQAAIEKVRSRVEVSEGSPLPPLPDEYYAAGDGSKSFKETLIRERAVELAFEGHRWFDLRRWNIAGELKYREKTAINFDLDANNKPVNFQEVVYVTRVFEKKHNWIPFQVAFTRIHEGFPQNPGW
jgi:hypothetical protein